MNASAARPSPDRRPLVAAALCALAGLAVFQFFGNGTRGYINTASLFTWWGRQWFDPAAESGQGPLIVGVAVWVFWRNLQGLEKETGDRSQESGVGQKRTGDRGQGTGSTAAGPAIPHSALRTPNCIAAATAAMLGGLALHALGYAAQQTRISIAAFLLFVWGALALAGGRRWARAAAFPVAFMVFAVPVNFLDSVGFPLRLAVTRVTTGLAHLGGAGVIRNGTQLFSPDGTFQYDVAAACSGVRSLTALAALSLLVGWLEFRGWGRRLAVAALCVPLAFAGNVARVTATVFAGEWFGQRGGERVHDAAGIGVFVVVLGGVLLAARVWQRWWPEGAERRRQEAGDRRQEMEAERLRTAAGGAKTGKPDAGPDTPRSAFRTPYFATALVLIAAVAAAWFTTRVGTWVTHNAGVRLAADGVNPVALPYFLNGAEGVWLGRDVAVTQVERDTLPADTGYSRKTYAPTRTTAGTPAREVLLSIVLSGRDLTSIHRPEICLVGQGWTIEGSFAHNFVLAGGGAAGVKGGTVPATVLRITHEAVAADGTRTSEPALLAYWFVGGDTVVATSWERVWRATVDRLLHFRAGRWAYVVAETEADDGEAAALARLQAVVGAAVPGFQTVTAGR